LLQLAYRGLDLGYIVLFFYAEQDIATTSILAIPQHQKKKVMKKRNERAQPPDYHLSGTLSLEFITKKTKEKKEKELKKEKEDEVKMNAVKKFRLTQRQKKKEKKELEKKKVFSRMKIKAAKAKAMKAAKKKD